MSTPPQGPPTFVDRSRGTDRDAPGEGRLASSGPSGLTRGGNTRTKFTPKVVARRTADGASTTPTPADTPRERRAPRGRGRGRGRGEVASLSGISGPFAAGPAGMTRSASARQLGRTVDTSITIADAPPSITTASQPLLTRTPQVPIKTESATPKKSTFAPPPKPPARMKKEEDVHGDGYAGGDLTDTLDRVDLSEINLPGGPISSNRRPEKRVGRGWKKIELWIEQADPEEIVIDDEDEQLRTSAPVSVKIEDGRMEDVVGEKTVSAHPMFVDLNENEELAQMAERRRRKLRREAMKGKSRAEKEEMAREEVDFEAMRSTFLNPDATQREERLFMLQLPLTLPPLRPIDEQITQEIKTEEGGTSASTAALVPSAPPPSGKIGQLRVHASGKTVLSYGGIDFPIRLANDIRFPQDCMVMEPHVDKKAWRVGRVGSRNEDCTWLIGVPDLKGMASNTES